jgi:UPF0042 nucleotide-binding protein
MIKIVSFGYKKGTIPEADAVVDCRVLRNPYNVPELKVLTGHDAKVREYLMKDPKWGKLLDQAEQICLEDNKCLAVGCYGGTHRAPAMAEAVAEKLRSVGLEVEVTHREIGQP